MEAHRYQMKLYATAASDGQAACDPEALVPVFHRWIKERRLNELLVDVTSYLHVHEGPGVLLVGHASDYGWDFAPPTVASPSRTAGEAAGLLVTRKRDLPPPGERLRDLVQRSLHAAQLLEDEPSLNGLHFDLRHTTIRILDRLASSDAAVKAGQDELRALLGTVLGPVEIAVTGGGGLGEEPVTYEVFSSEAPTVKDALSRLAS